MAEAAAAAPQTPVAAPAVTNGAANDSREVTEVKAVEPEASDTYVIDGKEVTLTRTQAKTYIQKQAAADKRLQQASEKEKAADAILKLFESDPEAALAKLGKDPQKMIAALMAKQAKLELMTPEQRERAALEAERDELKAKHEEAEKEKTTKAQAEMDARTFTALEEQLLGAANKHQLDGTPETLEAMCEVALEAIELGIAITPDQVAQEVIHRQGEHIRARDAKVLSKLTGDKLLAYLGAEKVKAVLEATKLQQPTPAAKPRLKSISPVQRSTKGYAGEHDFDRKLGFKK